jgi:acyl carrier protein
LWVPGKRPDFRNPATMKHSRYDGAFHSGGQMATDVEANDLETRVIRVIADTQKIPTESVGKEKTFEDLKIDSLDGINIVFALENEFGINIPDDGVQSMRSIGETVEGVRKLLALKTAESEDRPV